MVSYAAIVVIALLIVIGCIIFFKNREMSKYVEEQHQEIKKVIEELKKETKERIEKIKKWEFLFLLTSYTNKECLTFL